MSSKPASATCGDHVPLILPKNGKHIYKHISDLGKGPPQAKRLETLVVSISSSVEPHLSSSPCLSCPSVFSKPTMPAPPAATYPSAQPGMTLTQESPKSGNNSPDRERSRPSELLLSETMNLLATSISPRNSPYMSQALKAWRIKASSVLWAAISATGKGLYCVPLPGSFLSTSYSEQHASRQWIACSYQLLKMYGRFLRIHSHARKRNVSPAQAFAE